MNWAHRLKGIREAKDYAASLKGISETPHLDYEPFQNARPSLRERLRRQDASHEQSAAAATQAGYSAERSCRAIPPSQQHQPATQTGINEVQESKAVDGLAANRLPGSMAWDRRFRHLKLPAKTETPPEQPEGSSPPQAEVKSDPLHRSDALKTILDSSAAQGKSSDEDGLFDWEPKAKEVAEASGAGRKRKGDATKENKQRKKKARSPDDEALVLHERASAAPYLANAPHEGPDEPLLLRHDAGNGEPPMELQVPASINKFLRSYQRDGIRFLFRQYAQNMGGILADDMGLGKTVQTIGFLAAVLGKTGTDADLQPALLQEERNKQILLVVPTSVITNWQREFSTWGAFRVAEYHGPPEKRSAALQSILNGHAEILITSYDTCRLQIEEFLSVEWHAAVFDEAHKLKNDKSATYKAAAELHGVTKRLYGLTGTIMQNAHKELWALLSWANPGSLSDWTSFERHYVNPLKYGQKKDCTGLQLGKAERIQGELEKLLAKYVLRRTKDSTIKDQLPTKTDNIVFCRLAPLQHRAYKRVLETPDFQLLVRAEEPCDCGSGLERRNCCHTMAYPEDGGVLWPHFHLCDCTDPECKRHRPNGCAEVYKTLQCPVCLILPCLIILQKISNHLELLKVDPDDRTMTVDDLKLPRAKELARLVFGEDLEVLAGVTLEKSWLHVSSSINCGKMRVLEQLLHLWHSEGDNKVLLFCHSVKMLNIMEQLVLRAGYHYARLDGATRQQDRQQLVDEFNKSASLFLFLISTTAGGLGLNLTSANKVVIVDPSWNPSHDLQAQDRAFRIGQNRDVAVYRLVAAGTLEETIYTRQVYKQQQAAVATEGSKETRFFEGIQGMKEHKGELWGMGNLFRESLHKVTAQEVFSNERPDVHYHMRRMDTQQYGNLEEEEDAAPEVLPDDLGFLQGEDTGLGHLARRVAAEATEGADRAAGPSDRSPDADPPEVQHLEGTEMLAMHRHGELLGGNEEERRRRERAEREHATALDAEDGMAARHDRTVGTLLAPGPAGGGTTQDPTLCMNVLESLAAWKEMDVISMARSLLGMTIKARGELRRDYATAVRGPP